MNRLVAAFFVTVLAATHIKCEEKPAAKNGDPIAAEKLARDFKDAPAAAEKKYIGKSLTVEGPVRARVIREAGGWAHYLDIVDRDDAPLIRCPVSQNVCLGLLEKTQSAGYLAVVTGTLKKDSGRLALDKAKLVSTRLGGHAPKVESKSDEPKGGFAPVKEDGVWSLGFKVGATGWFRDAVGDLDGQIRFAVESVVSAKEGVVEAFLGSDREKSAMHYRFVIRGVDTSGWVDDKVVSLAEVYKVTGTAKVGGRTMFVIEPVKKP